MWGWGWGESIENSRQCMPPSPSSSSSTKISLMGHADLPDSFAENRCFIYALCYSHLLHASFEEAQGFWLKRTFNFWTLCLFQILSSSVHIWIWSCHFALSVQEQLTDKCLRDAEGSTVFVSWCREGQSLLLPAPAEWCWREITLRFHLWWDTGKLQGSEDCSPLCTCL